MATCEMGNLERCAHCTISSCVYGSYNKYNDDYDGGGVTSFCLVGTKTNISAAGERAESSLLLFGMAHTPNE